MGGKPSKDKIRAEFNNTIKKDTQYVWLKEMSAQVIQHAFEDLNKDLSIGVDLGVEKLAVINCLDKPIKNINKSVKVRKLKKKLKRLQRGLSRKYEANKKGNEFVSADRFYPSSKICSSCSSKKEELKLKDRIYVCDECGLEIDRDKNASINLGNYKIA